MRHPWWPHLHICDLFPAFLNTPGIQHAANYTGKVLRPAPPVYDPALVAKAMVKVALRPRSTMYIGGTSLPPVAVHGIFPGLTTQATGTVIGRYLQSAEPITYTDGNLFDTVDFGMATHGNASPIKKKGRKLMAAGVLAGLIAVILVASRR